jgi:hypothetical protein
VLLALFRASQHGDNLIHSESFFVGHYKFQHSPEIDREVVDFGAEGVNSSACVAHIAARAGLGLGFAEVAQDCGTPAAR